MAAFHDLLIRKLQEHSQLNAADLAGGRDQRHGGAL